MARTIRRDITGLRVGSRVVTGNPEFRQCGKRWVCFWETSCQKCGKIEHVQRQTLTSKYHGNSCRCDRMNAVTDAERAEMARLYGAGLSQGEIAEKTGRSLGTTFLNLKRAGVIARPPTETARTISVNSAAFDADTPESRYWLGFAITDGCVSLDKNTFSVNLAERDRDHLELLRTFLGSEHPIQSQIGSPDSFGPGCRMARLCVYSKPLCESLVRRGVLPRKSLIAVAPPDLENDPDFWRGAVDGDGWVGVQTGNGHPYCGLTGTRTICEQYLKWIRTLCDTNVNVTPNHQVFKVVVCGKFALRIISTLYDCEGPALARKAKTARAVITTGWNPKRKSRL